MVTCYRAIALAFGYVESNTTAWLIYRAEHPGFSTRRAALQSLVTYLWNKFSMEKNESHEFNLGYHYGDKCCQRFWLDTKYVNHERREVDPTHCGTCGSKYKKTWTFDEENWQEYLRDLITSDCDSYGDHDDVENPGAWSPWMYSFDIPQHQMIPIVENAEGILTDVLYDLHPELRPENDYVDSFPHVSDYDKLMDESYVINNYDGRYTKIKTEPDGIKVTTTFEYPNGAVGIMVDNVWSYIKYNTGDEIWLDFQNGEYKVIKLRDHTGREVTEWNRNPYGE